MFRFLPLALLIAAPARSEPLSERVDRDYVQPVLEQVQGAVTGRESDWTPPMPPGTRQSGRLCEEVRTRWIEPLFAADQAYMLDAARSLGSATNVAPPAEPGLASLLPVASFSRATEDIVAAFERRFLPRLFPQDYALGAAGALGSGGDDAGPPEPDQRGLTAEFGLAPAFGGPIAQAPRLKSLRSEFSANP
jgi:hypothetical protein